jgi:hypothetical protein
MPAEVAVGIAWNQSVGDWLSSPGCFPVNRGAATSVEMSQAELLTANQINLAFAGACDELPTIAWRTKQAS